jgi:CubicO group peptidase (beta-lactamase class C family)
MLPDTTHLLLSVSKSLVGTVVGILADRGLVELDAPVTRYATGLAGSGYEGATVRQVLDMRSGVRFSEDYLDPTAHVRMIEQAFGWATRLDPFLPSGMYPFLATLQAEGPHGGPFRYRSCETDVLGWVCEAATGQRFATLLSDLVWSPMGAAHDADIGVDAAGTGMFDGGISATLSDLARFGALWLQEGRSASGVQVIPPWWVEDTFVGGPDSADAFAAGEDAVVMPGGMYRNQFWFPHAHRSVMLALGIHGQMIYVNRSAEMVAVKLSSWPEPQSTWKLFSTLRAFDTIAETLG